MRAAAGRAAASPTGRLFGDVLKRLRQEHIPFLAAGLAYYGMLALVPGLIALVSLYGLIADRSDVATVISNISEAAPAEVVGFIQSQLTDIVEAPASGLGFGAAISLLAALWAASAGTKSLIRGVNLAFGAEEVRSAVRLRLLSVGITIGVVLFVGVALGVASVGANLLEGQPLLGLLRWPFLGLITIGGLSTLYRLAPSEREPNWRDSAIGASAAAVGWLTASIGLSLYVANFGSFNETYGTLGAVIVTMLWLYVSGLVVLVGAVLAAALHPSPAPLPRS